MRTKTIISGFKNSQKFRFILKAGDGTEVGLTMTVQQMSDMFATRDARVAVWRAMQKLAYSRDYAKRRGETLPDGIVTDGAGFQQVQIDLH